MTDISIWGSLLSLTALEIILGIDNVVFIALLVQHLPDKQRAKARVIALSLALVMRIVLLFGIAWIMQLTEPLFSVFDHTFSGKDLLMLLGGGFLIYKATGGIHEEVTHEKAQELEGSKKGFGATIVQALLIDLVFSFDSVITAVGITTVIPVIVVAMTIAMIVMIFSASYISDFIQKYPTLKMLALSFILLIGLMLVGEGLGFHVPKGYIYFGMSFSLFVELLNILGRRRKQKKALAKAS